MSDIQVRPLATGWTVRHDRILFERFENRAAALRRARQLASALRLRGQDTALRIVEPDERRRV